MGKRSKNDLVSQYLSLEADVSDGDGSEDEHDEEEGLENFIDTRDISDSRPTPIPPRIPSLGDSAEDLEREAQAIKDRHIAARQEESSDDEPDDSHIYQVFVKPRNEKEVQERLRALDSTFGITNVQHRTYLPGRLWVSTNKPDMIREALFKCDVYTPGRFWIPNNSTLTKEPSMYGRDVWPQRKWAHKSLSRELLEWKPESLPKAGQWVRATRGLYKGDLAFVLMHSSFTDILQIAVVPRLPPYSPSQHGTSSSGKKRKSSVRSSRPTPSLFDPVVAQTECFMEEQERVATLQEQSEGAATQGSVQRDVDVPKLLTAVEKLVRFKTEEDQKILEVPYTLPNGTPRLEHEGEKLQDTCYQYKGAIFIGGLLIKSVYGSQYRLEFYPSKQEMVAFVHSRIWPARILPQFVARHWKEGDKVFFSAGNRGIPGTLVNIESDTATVRPDLDARDNVNDTGACILTEVAALHRRWSLGDGVKATAGVDMGKEGTIVQVFDDPPYVDFLDKESLTTVSVPTDYTESFNVDSGVLHQAHTFLVGERVKVKAVDGELKRYAGTTGVIEGFAEKYEVFIALANPEAKNKVELITLPIALIERLDETSRAGEQLAPDAKSSLLNLRVYVVEGPDKGKQGEIRDASGSDNKYLVNLAFMTAEIPRRYSRKDLALVLEGNVGGSRLDKKSDEDLLREVHHAKIHKQAIDRQSTVRGKTPEPVAESSTTQNDLLESFGVLPAGDLEFPEWPSAPEEPSFLFDGSLWTSIGSRQIRVRFADTYDEGRWYGKVITCPSKHTGPQGQMDAGLVALEATNKKTKLVALVVDAKHLRHLPPAFKNADCVPLNGERRGHLLKVFKINKAAKTASVVSDASTSRWEEELDNLCVVEDSRSNR